MKIINIKKRELFDLSLVVIITITFSLFSLSINLIERVCNYFNAFTSLPIAEFLINAIFLWLIGLLWVTYRLWKKAVKKKKELENIISSISPDVLMVVDRNRNIIMCNTSVKRMFGYEVEEVINQKTDLLYFDRRSKTSHTHEIHDALERVGFHIGEAAGKKKNGDIISLEIITTKLSGHEGAALLLRDTSDKKREIDSIKNAYSQLMQIFNTAAGGIRVIDADFNVLLINDTFKTLAPISENEIAGKKCYEAFYSHLCHTLSCPMTKILGGEEKVELDVQFECKEGGKVPCFVTATPFRDSDGEPIGIVENFLDITERKKAEKQIKESGDFLKSVIENSKDGIFVVDEKGYIVSCNTTMEEMSGFSKKEMMGKHASTLVVEDEKIRRKILEKTAELFDKGFTTYEATYKSKEGKYIDAECTSSMIKNKEGDYIAGVAIIRDITERKKAEQKITESRDFLENISKTSADGIMITSKGIITMVNEALEKMLGYSKDDLIGQHSMKLSPKEKTYQERGKQIFSRLFKEGVIFGEKMTWLKKDGSLVDVEVNAALLKDNNGEITGSVSNIRDITEKKKFQETLKMSEEKYRGLMENANDAIISANKDGIIIDFNKKAEEMFGYSREEIIGKPVVLPSPPSERARQKEFLERAKAINNVDKLRTTWVGKALRKDGQEFFVETSNFGLELGGEYVFTIFVRDITERRELERKLIQSEKSN